MSYELTPHQLRAIVADVQDALVVTDPTGQVIHMNPAAIELFDFRERYGDGDETHVPQFVIAV